MQVVNKYPKRPGRRERPWIPPRHPPPSAPGGSWLVVVRGGCGRPALPSLVHALVALPTVSTLGEFKALRVPP